MKNKWYRCLLAVLFSFSVLTLSVNADAYCTMVPTHWVNGYKVPAHKVCSGGRYRYGYAHCKWIPGHWRNGYYHEGHRACVR